MDYHNLEIENGLCCSKSLFSTLNKKYDELLMPLQLCQKSSKKSINIQIPAAASNHTSYVKNFLTYS